MSAPPTDATRTERSPSSRSVVHEAVRWFLGWSLVTLLVVAGGTVLIADNLAKDGVLREARLRGARFGQDVAGPLVNAGVRAGDPRATAMLDSVMRNRLRDGSIVHIKLWDSDGGIIWSDERNLVGKTFRLEPKLKRLFGTDEVVAGFSHLSGRENAGERPEKPHLEVYAGARDSAGAPMVFEAYWSTDHVRADETAIMRRLVPLGLGSLLLFQLALMPLAVSLARRVDRARADRSTMLRHALSASDLERRRIAQDLHDGLLQDLAGLGYALPSVSAALPPGSGRAHETLAHAVSVVQHDISALRLLLTDIYPADLATGGLAEAVNDLARRAAESGVHVDVDVDAVPSGTSQQMTQLAYRVIREGLRNVVKHAEATHVEVSARVDGPHVITNVSDNGKGAPSAATASGHLGLRVLADTLRDVGGQLVLEGRSGGGTSLTATFPLGAVGVSPH